MKDNKIFDFSRVGFQNIINIMTKKINEVIDITNEMIPNLDDYISKVDWNKIINSDLYQKVLDDLAETTEQVGNNTQQLNGINSEINTARKDYNGYTHDNLKARIDSDVYNLDWYINKNKEEIISIESNANNIKLIAHRGLSSLAPENTLPAYELAGKYGYWGLKQM